MTTTALYIVAGTLLGLLQMALGIAIGLWIRRDRGTDKNGDQLDAAQAAELIARLSGLTSGITQDVQGHRDHIAQISDRLIKPDAAGPGSLAEIVVGVVGEVLKANGELQNRLSSAEAQLQKQSKDLESYLTRALTDELTGLPNRRAFDDQLLQRLSGFARHGVPFSLMLVDVDHFKSVNDTHGHVAGDCVLRSIAKALRDSMRQHDVVARYGGEEFAVLLPYTSLDGAAHAARHARLAVQNTVTQFDGATILVTASAGLASVREEDDAITIVKRADDALYASKSGGRNCGHLHDGTACVRILVDDETAPDEEDHAEDTSISTSGDAAESRATSDSVSRELAAACAELRDFAANAKTPSVGGAGDDFCKL